VLKKVIKRIIEPGPKSLIALNSNFKEYIEKFESEINRGISTLCILVIIKNAGEEGTYGYQILKDLKDETKNLLVIEEGTLYPLLRKLEKEKFIASKRLEVDGRLRKNYFITENGLKCFNRMEGFYSLLTEAISPLFDVNVKLMDRYFYCPDCANKIDLSDKGSNFCEVCGKNIKIELKERGMN